MERELCERIGVSRTSIREALRQLETEGLVSTIPNQGPIVTKVTLEEAEDLYQVREMFECLASRLFAQKASHSEMEDLARAVRDLENANAKNDLKQFLAVKKRFYEVLLTGSGNQVAHSMHRSLIARINFLRETSLAQPGRPQQSVAEIKRLLEAIQKRDPEEAWNVCGEHVRNAAHEALRGLREESSRVEAAKSAEERYGKQ